MQPLGNPTLFSDNSYLLSSTDFSFKRNVLPTRANLADDTFDKLFYNVKKVDPFDQLLENVDETKTDPFDQLFSNTSPNKRPLANQGLYSSEFSTPNESGVFSTDTSHELGLFSSFSKQDVFSTEISNKAGLYSFSKQDVFSKQEKKQKSPKLKRLKSNRNVRRNKKHSARDVKQKENILSETLEVKIVFEGDVDAPLGHHHTPIQVSSLTQLSPTRGRGLSALSVATSTPVLASKFDRSDFEIIYLFHIKFLNFTNFLA